MNKKDLFNVAKDSMKNSYAPYSNYNVGAALLCKSGNVYKGCNLENASYSLTNCAERTALFSAIANGEKEFEAICVVGGKSGVVTDYATPCGACRQALAEFCNDDFKVYVGINEDNIKEYTLSELLPYSFNKSKLGE
ncbi:MAG: cytidine deaminase [Clostridia bacterium]|nr:cytidine deaminase [Clostridia bacterium]